MIRANPTQTQPRCPGVESLSVAMFAAGRQRPDARPQFADLVAQEVFRAWRVLFVEAPLDDNAYSSVNTSLLNGSSRLWRIARDSNLRCSN
jgi:hypothetical protein